MLTKLLRGTRARLSALKARGGGEGGHVYLIYFLNVRQPAANSPRLRPNWTNKTKPPFRRAVAPSKTAATTMSGWAGKEVPSFDVTMVSSNGTVGAKMPLSALLGKPLVIHLYNGG